MRTMGVSIKSDNEKQQQQVRKNRFYIEVVYKYKVRNTGCHMVSIFPYGDFRNIRATAFTFGYSNNILECEY